MKLAIALLLTCATLLAGCGGGGGSGGSSTSSTSNSSGSGSGTQTGTSTASEFTAPTLVNASSPVKYGAKCDGTTDDSAAFQAAVNAGDVEVPAATCVINASVNITMSNRHIQCDAGAVLSQTNAYAGHMFNIYSPTNATLTGDSIVDCTFVGSNTAAPQYYTDARQQDIPVETEDYVSNFLLAGNTFRQFYGQSTFQTYGTTNGGSGDVIEYNTFQSCGYYGPVLDAHTNGYVGHNIITDCAIGVENDNTSQNTGGNVLEYNTVTAVYGYGAPYMNDAAFITGGIAASVNYSGNIVRNNTVSGVSGTGAFEPVGQPTAIWETATGGSAAQYSNNTCGTGCQTD